MEAFMFRLPQVLAEAEESMFGAPRFDSFTQGRGWRRAAAELALSLAAFFAVAGVILAIRAYLHLG
jgi:hypothetical protein